jgi:tripartite ATP-independent transporter DctP family solute receptor
MKQPIKLRWVLAHIPYDLFLRSATAFANQVKARSNGEIEVEVMGQDQWEERYNGGQCVSKFDFMQMVNDGTIEMSQMYTVTLGQLNKDFRLLDLPFLFEDHDHATRVLDGEVGKYLLEGLTRESDVKGLAFTYSGGFRMIPSNKEIKSIDDLKGVKMRVGLTPVAEDTFKAIGANPEQISVDYLAQYLKEGKHEAGENTFPRFFRAGVNEAVTHVSNSQHSLFLTTIIINNKIWNNLSPEHQAIIKESAQSAALEERHDSLVDGEQSLQRCYTDGIKVTDWAEDEVARFKEATKEVYVKYENYFTDADLINKAKNA